MSPTKTPMKSLKHRFFQEFPQEVSTFPCPVALTNPAAVHHLRNVLRLGPGAAVMVLDGVREKGYAAEIITVGRDKVDVMVLSLAAQADESSLPHVTLGAALIKGQRWDWLLQKVTELGVRTIVPLVSERAVIETDAPEQKKERWQAVVQSAAEQSEGLFYPKVALPMHLKDFCDQVRACPTKGILLTHGKNRVPLREILREQKTAGPMAFAVGPEGGWSEDEAAYWIARGFRPASLGDRILRSETAAVALLSAVAYEYDTGRS